MKISFIRHGESEVNVLGIMSSRVEENHGLTENGIKQIEDASLRLDDQIDAIYSSPMARTVQSANLILKNYSKDLNLFIDDRIKEIDYGKYSGKMNNKELDAVRKKQISGDYKVRFGDFGENKHEIVSRICSFLKSLIEEYDDNSHVVVVSHGSIINFIERLILKINNSKQKRQPTKNASIKILHLNKSNLVDIQSIADDLRNRKRNVEQPQGAHDRK